MGGGRRVAVLLAVVCLGAGACGDDSEPGATGPVVVDVGAGAPLPGVVPEDVAARFGDAVWRVETNGCDWVGSGSAFAVDSRHLVTNHHVVANDTSPLIRSRDGRTRDGRVIGVDAERDVAVIEVADDLPDTLAWAQTAALQPAEHLVVLGYPVPDLVFQFTSGTIVDFYGPGVREAVLSNAPIDRGNSGGPALRGDGSVIGVVTQMTLDDPTERVAIVFTAERVLPAVEAALDAPRDVLSDCGFGPDYVPPVPDGYDIPAPPPPPPPPPSSSVSSSTSPSSAVPPRPTLPPPTTPTTIACPAPDVAAEVTESSVQESGEPGLFDVDARGTVTNQTAAEVYVDRVEIDVGEVEPVREDLVGGDYVIDPGETAVWEFYEPVATRDPEPPLTVTVVWGWIDARLSRCPSA